MNKGFGTKVVSIGNRYEFAIGIITSKATVVEL